MRIPFPDARGREAMVEEALDIVRCAMRSMTEPADMNNPFARPLPCPIVDTRRTARILRIF